MISVVIPAAGQGKRMGQNKNKQFLLLNEKPILAHTINKFQNSEVDEIIIVAREEEIEYCQQQIVEKYEYGKVIKIVSGGKTRQESVNNGLRAVNERAKFVLIHDGARPLLTKELIADTIAQVKHYNAVAVGVPVKDTIKVVDNNDLIIDTPDRSKLVAIQTPQAFAKELVVKAYEQAFKDGFIGTDSSSLIERLGIKIKLIKGSYTNLKITTPEDLKFAEKLLVRRQK